MLHLSRGLAETNHNNRPRYGFVRNVLPARLTDKYGELYGLPH